MLDRPLGLAPPHLNAAAWIAERRTIIACWAGSRVIVVLCVFLLHEFHTPRGFFDPSIFRRTLGPLEAWDGVWYRHIAQHGYLLVPGRQSDPAFFPLYPVLLKLLAAAEIPVGTGGVLFSNLCFLGALLAFDTLGRELLSPQLARRATVLLAVFPTTYVCSMLYPESLALLAFALTGLFALRDRWLACSLSAAVAALARPEGVLLFLPVAGCLLARWRGLAPERRGQGLAALLAAPAAAVSFPLYLGLALHDPFAWTKAQQAWGRSFRVSGPWHAFSRLGIELSRHPGAWRDVTFCLVTFAMLAAAWRAGAPASWIVLGVLLVVIPLGSGSFDSEARFGLLALPGYWGLAWICRDRRVYGSLLAAAAAMLAFATLTLPLVFP